MEGKLQFLEQRQHLIVCTVKSFLNEEGKIENKTEYEHLKGILKRLPDGNILVEME